jgi:hypothetical protein
MHAAAIRIDTEAQRLSNEWLLLPRFALLASG